jgi:hypothetical protein
VTTLNIQVLILKTSEHTPKSVVTLRYLEYTTTRVPQKLKKIWFLTNGPIQPPNYPFHIKWDNTCSFTTSEIPKPKLKLNQSQCGHGQLNQHTAERYIKSPTVFSSDRVAVEAPEQIESRAATIQRRQFMSYAQNPLSPKLRPQARQIGLTRL